MAFKTCTRRGHSRPLELFRSRASNRETDQYQSCRDAKKRERSKRRAATEQALAYYIVPGSLHGLGNLNQSLRSAMTIWKLKATEIPGAYTLVIAMDPKICRKLVTEWSHLLLSLPDCQFTPSSFPLHSHFCSPQLTSSADSQ